MEELINKIAQRSSGAVNENDYQKDGLWYCGECNTPKQGRYEMPWGVVTPFVMCECETARAKEIEDKRKARERAERIDRMRRICFQSDANSGRMAQWTFDADNGANPAISTAARKYAENFAEMRKHGKGLLLFGDVGRGKTFAAACIANALIDNERPCYMTNFATLRNVLMGMTKGKQEYIDSLNAYDLLVIDDLAAEADTQYMNEVVYNVVDSRYRSGLPTIVTTNLTAKELKNPADINKARIYSRLLEMCLPVEVVGQDQRKEKLKAEANAYKQMLGL